jgi:hypothetical protein
MQKLFIFFIIANTMLWSATAEQVEEYLSVSTAEEELIALEAQFSSMQNSFSAQEDQKTYDMQLLSLRFKDSLQRSLSENEMNEILENYKNVLYLQFISTNTYTPDKNETKAYLFKLQEDESAQERIDILEQISKALNNKDSMLVMFDELMKPLLQSANGGTNIDDKMMEQRKEIYIKSRIEDGRKETLYNLKDFSIEELETLLDIVKTASVQREVKSVYAATAYALKEFFLSMASRYDISKHDPSKYSNTQQETNNTDNTK